MEANANSLPLPDVMKAPIRPDILQDVHRDISKNSRQPYAVSRSVSHQTSAESWGTGRVVSRISCVLGGDTHRAGQGAYGNMCSGGRIASLVMACCHRIESVLQIPCVISDSAEAIEKTSNAISLLKKIGAYPDAEKAKDS
nr:60S ribosomal protein L4-1-like [Coffea arabica]